jgi:AcrR family transcriptional regulator
MAIVQTRSGQARKRRGDGDQRRDEILEAARALFAKNGADRTTMRAVADAVGISATAVYSYFPDKTALYDAVAQAAFVELGQRFTAAAETPDPIARLQAMMRAYVRFGHDHADAYAIAFSPSLHSRPGPTSDSSEDFAKEAGEQAFEAFHRAVSDVPGLVDPQSNSEHLSRVIWAAGHGLVVLSRSKAEALPAPIEIYADALFHALLRKPKSVFDAERSELE